MAATPATPEPATPATADAAAPSWVVGGSRVNLRALPEPRARVLATLTRGTAVSILESQGDYSKVRIADGTEGWIRADLLRQDAQGLAGSAPAQPATTAAADASAGTARPPASDTPETAQAHRRAMEQIRAGNLSEAERTLRELLKTAPGHVPAMQSLSGLLIQSGQRPQLAELIGAWEAQGVAPINLRLLRARLRIEQGEPPTAVLASQPLDPASLSINDALTLANLQQQAGDHAAAASTARQVLGREPTLGSAWATLALSLDQQGQNEPARDAWQKALDAGGLTRPVADHARQRLAQTPP